jgi:uncharacterized hydrophobic protein (TIGR00271 family)
VNFLSSHLLQLFNVSRLIDEFAGKINGSRPPKCAFFPVFMENKNPSTKVLQELREQLLADAQLDTNFLVLTLSSCIIATLGLLMDSSAVIIGAMIIAPLMMPLRALALGALDADFQLLRQSLITLGMGTLVAILISALVGGIFQVPALSFGSEILARSKPNLADLGVALAAGAISGFAKIRPQIGDALAGTAISVALMPPLCVVGIGISQRAGTVSGGAFLLYSTNFLGITLACILVFIWGGYAIDSQKMRQAVGWFIGLISLLILPLFLSLFNLIQRERLEGIIRDNLQRRTITFGQQTRLISLDVRWSYPWSQTPSKLTLVVQAIPDREPVTSQQVKNVEDYLQERMGRKFKITVQVSQFVEITSDEPKPSPLSDDTNDLIIDPTTEDPSTTISP